MYNNLKLILCVILIKCFNFLIVLLMVKDVVDNYCFNIDYEVFEFSIIIFSIEFMVRICKLEEKVFYYINDFNLKI